MMEIDHIPVIDTHCHPFPPGQIEITAQDLRDALSLSLRGETPVENQTTMLSRMTIKAMAELLDCEASWDAVIAARNLRAKKSVTEYYKALWTDAGIGAILIDPGYPLGEEISSRDFAEVMPCPVFEGYRIERFFPGESFHDVGFGSIVDFVDAFRAKLDAEANRTESRFFKSVIAYRTGLAINKVSEREAKFAWTEHKRYGDPSEKVLRDYLFLVTAQKAKEHSLPFQVHTGHTSHVNPWPSVNPILLTPILNDPDMADVRFVLVHGGYPYCTEAGYLTSVYPNLMLDLSLMIPWSSIGIARRIEETLESAPTSKIMYGSDAIEVPELYWISAKNARRALQRVLERLQHDDVIGADEAIEIAEAILYRNAERVYGVSGATA